MPGQSEKSSQPSQTTLAQDLMALAGYGFRSRTGKILIGGSLIAGGMFFGWDWLVAAGLAPVVLGILPCAAMCAVGLCMNRAGGKSCSPGTGDTGDTDSNTQVKRAVDASNHRPVRKIDQR